MNAILLAILNSLWQSAILAAAVWLLLKFARGTNAATRHAVWWAVLAIAIALPLIPPRAPAPIPAALPEPAAAFALEPAPPTVVSTAPSRPPVELPRGDWPAIVFAAWTLACLVH